MKQGQSGQSLSHLDERLESPYISHKLVLLEENVL